MSSGEIIDTIQPLDLTPALETGFGILDDVNKGLEDILGPVPVPGIKSADDGPIIDVPSVSNIEDYFIRIIVVILGFIFVAVGLSMFKG